MFKKIINQNFIMKKILVTALLATVVNTIEAQSTTGEQVAGHIAQKMKDSLDLTNALKQQVLTINLQLHNQKSVLWQQFATSDSLGVFVQRVENTRDSLYRNILDEGKYILYKQKKKNLISND